MASNRAQYVLWPPNEEGGENYQIIEEDDIIEEQGEISPNEDYHQTVQSEEDEEGTTQHYYIGDNLIEVAQETFVYLTEDGSMVAADTTTAHSNVGVGMSHLIEQRVEEAENKIIGDQDGEEYTETIEEVINEEDWVETQDDIVTVGNEQIIVTDNLAEDELEAVPLPLDQDEYTSSRPYPCDFCSRRFRKKANLMNHMVSHQNDRPHTCQICRATFIRRHDLMTHLKFHAYDPVDFNEAAKNVNELRRVLRDISKSSGFDTDQESETASDDQSHEIVPKYKAPNPPIKRKQPRTQTAKRAKKAPKTAAAKSSTASVTVTSNNIYTIPAVEKFPITDDRKPFVCQTCGVAFTRQKALESHARLHENETYDCPICNESFYDEKSMTEHVTAKHHHNSQDESMNSKSSFLEDFDVDDSNSDFDPGKNLEDDDDDDEDNEVNDEFNCAYCDSFFKSMEQLKRHINKIHEGKKEPMKDLEKFASNNSQNYCKECYETFPEALDLLAHAEIHARGLQFKCDICLATFVDEEKLKSHLQSNHSSEMSENSCRLCGKYCDDQKQLIKHSFEHSRDRHNSCAKCGKTFHNKARLKRHLASHKKKSAVCEVCNESFPDGRSLMNHRHSHTKSNQFSCYECGKTFGSRSSQQIHIRIHTGERPYSCRFCWKSFCDGGTLRKHERIHTGEKPYACLVCPRAFNQRVVLREHIRSHHSAPDPKNGTRENPYYCTLCNDVFPVSLDLIAHLIQHSDESTASKRTPIVGPRKYKRRRKLKPHEMQMKLEYDDVPMEGPSSQEDPDHSGDFHGFPSQLIKHEKMDTPLTLETRFTDNTYTNERNLNNPANLIIPDNILDSGSYKEPIKIISANTSSSGRPKMIHTQKTKIQMPDGSRKTTTVVTKHGSKASQKTSKETKKSSNTRTRSSRLLTRPKRFRDQSPTVEPTEAETADCIDILNEKYSERFDKDIVHDLQEILRSPVKQKNSEDEQNKRRSKRQETRRSKIEETATHQSDFEDQFIEEKVNNMQKDSDDDEDEGMKITIKQEFSIATNDCEICGDSFESRKLLLEHIHIHI